MRHQDVEPGQQVLYRPFRGRWPAGDGEVAEVTETGIRLAYQVSAQGRPAARRWRRTSHGVRLRVTRHDRAPAWHQGATPLPATYEVVTRPAFLRPATGGALARWQAARAPGAPQAGGQ
jgi:hypothetical protein